MSRESIFRIPLVLFVFLVWLMMIVFPIRNALAGDYDHPKKKPPVVVTPTVISDDNDQRWAYAGLSAAASGLLTTAMRGKEHGALWAFGGTVAGAALIEAAHSGGFNNTNLWYAVGGAAVGSVGVCALYFRKNFVGCAIPF